MECAWFIVEQKQITGGGGGGGKDTQQPGGTNRKQTLTQAVVNADKNGPSRLSHRRGTAASDLWWYFIPRWACAVLYRVGTLSRLGTVAVIVPIQRSFVYFVGIY